MPAGKRLKKLWKYLAVALLAVAAISVSAVALSGRGTSPVAANPGIAANAAQYSAKVEAQMEAERKAAAEALLIRLKFRGHAPLRVLFAGDTITGGYFASTQAKGFTQIVGANLAKRGEVEEVRGPKTGGKVETLGGLSDIPSDLDLAVLQLGAIELGLKEEPAQVGKQYETVLRNMKARSPKVAIVCLSVWQSAGLNASGYDRIIREKCQAQGGQFVDVSALFVDSRNRGPAGTKTWAGSSDTFHPNDKGHKAIADLVLARLRFS